MNNELPWVEKYRPRELKDIVLEKNNKKIFNNMINRNIFPNLLFYGPPGTGKTTTIINIIQNYQMKIYNKPNNTLILHLNASDDRGIEIIRNQIYNFAISKPLFSNGLKFIILDEADYMTKTAQHALRNLIEIINVKDICFCLICNYITKLESSLQNNFLKIKFNNLPHDNITHFLQNIIKTEKLNISTKSIIKIQNKFTNDLRSMINYLQTNQYILNNIKVIDDEFFNNLTNKLKTKKNEQISHFLSVNSLKYNLDEKSIIKDYLKYILYENNNNIDIKLLIGCEPLFHYNIENSSYINYFIFLVKSVLLK